MTFPTASINTSNLDSATDDPSLARADLLSAVQALNSIIDGANGSGGVALLNSSGKISSGQMPNTIASTGTLTLAPTTDIVNMATVLRMPVTTVSAANSLVGMQPGDIAVVSNGDAGSLCLAVHNGANWLRVSLGAAISET